MMKELKQSQTITIKRSKINFAPYNPKNHSKEQVKAQLGNFKRVGFLGGIVWNKTTGNLVSGHKRVMAQDQFYGYDGTNDYDIKVEMVEMDEKTEKEQNIYMDSHNTNTQQDLDLLRDILPEIDYKMAGLTDQDLNLIGVDYLLETEAERSISNSLDEFMEPVISQKQAEKQAKKELSREEKIEHSKKVKGEVNQGAQDKVDKMESYVMVTFDSMDAKADFMERFGFDPFEKFIKGEAFSEMIERVE